MMQRRNMLLSAALTGLLLGAGTFGCSSNSTSKSANGQNPEDEDMIDGRRSALEGKCYGVNTCKGQGACGGKGTSCAGKNTCKGEGWVKSTKEQCEEEGGSFES